MCPYYCQHQVENFIRIAVDNQQEFLLKLFVRKLTKYT